MKHSQCFNWPLYQKLRDLVQENKLEQFTDYFTEYDPTSLNLSSLQSSILSVVDHQEV